MFTYLFIKLVNIICIFKKFPRNHTEDVINIKGMPQSRRKTTFKLLKKRFATETNENKLLVERDAQIVFKMLS